MLKKNVIALLALLIFFMVELFALYAGENISVWIAAFSQVLAGLLALVAIILKAS